MQDRFFDWLGTRQFKLVASLWLLLAVNMLVMELSDVVATAGFVSNVGSDYLPWLWILMTSLTLFAAGGYSLLVDRYSRLNLITWLLGLTALLYVVLMYLFRVHVSEKITYPLLSVMTDQQYYILPLAFWALANDVFSVTEGKKVFPLIASGAVIGSLAGNSLAGYSANFLENRSAGPEVIFVMAATVLVLSVIVLRVAFWRQYVRARQSGERETSLARSVGVGVDYFSNVPSLRMVAIIMPLTGMALALLEFYFLRSIEANTSGNAFEYQQFLGYFKTAQTVGLLAFQWVITRRLLEKIPIKNAFGALPAFLVIGSVLALGIPGVLGVAAARFIARVIQRGWDEPTRKSLQGLIPDERRGRIALFMDTVFYNFATIASCILIALLLALLHNDIISDQLLRIICLGVASIAAVFALVSAVTLSRVYEKSLLDWRFARSRRKSVLDNIEF